MGVRDIFNPPFQIELLTSLRIWIAHFGTLCATCDLVVVLTEGVLSKLTWVVSTKSTCKDFCNSYIPFFPSPYQANNYHLVYVCVSFFVAPQSPFSLID